jgi:L-threonylcarbamoyladenylate synthase
MLWKTLIKESLRRDARVPRELHGGTGRLAVRVPGHEAALVLIEEAGGALVGTSANLHGREPPRTAEEALAQLGDRVDVVVDAGPVPVGAPSTILDLSSRPPRVLRRGAVPVSRLRLVLGELVVVD